jgi:hypothetical protein
MAKNDSFAVVEGMTECGGATANMPFVGCQRISNFFLGGEKIKTQKGSK